MKEKTQYEALIEELQKIVENFRDGVIEIGERLSKLLPDIEIPEEEEDTWEMKCPYKVGEDYWILFHDGTIDFDCWDNQNLDRERLSQGCLFPTEEAAELEAKRRNLLTRFRAFRDECNGDWKADWNKRDDKYYLYLANECKEIVTTSISLCEAFPLFGYFKNRKDLERAIELFGDEIKELFVECE